MAIKYVNNAFATLLTSITSGSFSLTVAFGKGALFPVLSAGTDYFYCTLSNVAGTLFEIVLVTAVTGDTFSISRGQDNTTALAWNAGDLVELRLVSIYLKAIPVVSQANTFTADTIFSSTGSVLVSSGTTAQRPTPSVGMLRYNTTTNVFEGFSGTGSPSWQTLSPNISPAIATFSAYQTVATGSTSGVPVKIALQAVEFNVGTAFDNATNYRFQPTAAGYYQLDGCLTWNAITQYSNCTIYRNGVEYKRGGGGSITAERTSQVSAIVYFNGSTDYAEMWGIQNSGANPSTVPGAATTYFQGAAVGVNNFSTGTNTAFSAYSSTLQTIPTGVPTKVLLQTKEFDTTGAFDNVTNYRYQPTTAGYYQVNGLFTMTLTYAYPYVAIYKNGAEYKRGAESSFNSSLNNNVSAVVYLNGSTDYIEMYFYEGDAGNSPSNPAANLVYFQAALVGLGATLVVSTSGAYQSAAQAIPDSTLTKILLQTKEFDTQSVFDNVTNYRFQPAIAGYYQIEGAVTYSIDVHGSYVTLYKNGSEFKRGRGACVNSKRRTGVVALIYFNGSSDYVEMWGFHSEGSAQNTVAGSALTYFQTAIVGIGSAVAASRQGPAFSATQTTLQAIPNATPTKIAFQSVEFDTNSAYNSTTTYRFTPQSAGYYLVSGSLQWADADIPSNSSVAVYVNGVIAKQGQRAGNAHYSDTVIATVYMNGSSDYMELWTTQSKGVSANTKVGVALTYFQCAQVR